MTKIAYISDFLPDYHTRAGGADWACYRVGELMKEEFDIEYYVCPADKKNVNKNNKIRFVPIIETLFPRFVAKYMEILKWYSLQFDPIAFIYFFYRFLKHRPDILHVHRFRFITMSPMIVAKWFKIPIYFSVYDYWLFCALETLVDDSNNICRKFHGVWCWKCLPQKFVWLQKMLLVYRKKCFDKIINNINKFVVLSTSSKNILKSYDIPDEKIYIIPLPYSKEIQQSDNDIKPENNSVLYVGWIQKRKGLDVLLQALAIVNKMVPTIKLYVIGPDVKWEKAYRTKVDDIIKQNNLYNSIVWLGAQPNSVVQKYIKQCEIVVVPEQWENMSPVIIGEVMFNNRPVIASNIGGIPDFVIDNITGLLIDPTSVEQLSTKLAFLVKNKDKAKTMGLKARQTAETVFSNKSIKEKYLRIYNIYSQVE